MIAPIAGNFHFQAPTIAKSCPHVYPDTPYLDSFRSRSLRGILPEELIVRAIQFADRETVLFGSELMSADFIMDCVNIRQGDRKLMFWKDALYVLGKEAV